MRNGLAFHLLSEEAGYGLGKLLVCFVAICPDTVWNQYRKPTAADRGGVSDSEGTNFKTINNLYVKPPLT